MNQQISEKQEKVADIDHFKSFEWTKTGLEISSKTLKQGDHSIV